MKRTKVWAGVMALVLAVSPFGSLRVSAAEPETGSVQESRANVSLPMLGQLQFLDNWMLKFGYGGSEGPEANIQVLKDGEVYYEEVVSFRKTKTHYYQFPLSCVIEESGSYQAKVWIENRESGDTYGPETTETKSHIRPEAMLGTTTGYWDEEQEGLFHYPAVKGASGYTYRLLKYNDESGQWETKPPIDLEGVVVDSVDDVSFQYWTAGPMDAGGEDRTRDFSEYIKYYGAGSYCVSVKALSRDIAEIANGVEGEISPALIFDGSSDDSGSDDADGSDDSASADSFVFTEDQIEQANPGDTIKITNDQNITCLSNDDMKKLLERGDVALEMEYTYEGVNYKIRIPAGKAMNNDIQWYGPLYLLAHYRVDRFDTASDDVANYTVKAGDSLSKIAKAYKMTLKELVAKNPQIQNQDVISVGQKITIK